MRHWMSGLLVASCVLSACDLPLPGATPSKRPTTVRPTGTTSPSPRPTILVTPRPSASPAGPTVRFSGKIEVDAHYLLANNAGSVISNSGGSVIALKGGKLISAKGLGLLSDNGLGLLSDNGLGIIANNSGGLVSNNGAGYRTLAASVALGTILPVKGMAVIPLSMRTGEVVGRPVFTDERGGYALDLPQSLKGSVRIVARVPVASQTDPIAEDPRVQYTLVVNAGSAAGASPTPTPSQTATSASPTPSASAPPVAASTINEDTALVTKYLRACFSGRVKEMMLTEDIEQTTKNTLKKLEVPAALLDVLKGTFIEVNKAAKEVGVAKLPADRIDMIAQRASDVLLSYIDVETLMVDPDELKRPGWGYKERAVAGMTDVIYQIRDGATAKMKENPAFFESQPYIKATGGRVQIRKPSDLGDFMVEEFMLSSVDRGPEVDAVFLSVGVPVLEARRLNTVCLGILATVGKVLFSNAEAKGQVLEAIRGAKK